MDIEPGLSPGTTSDYVGLVKEIIRKRFPKNAVWINHDTAKNGKNNSEGWFTAIKTDIERRGLLLAIEEGKIKFSLMILRLQVN